MLQVINILKFQILVSLVIQLLAMTTSIDFEAIDFLYSQGIPFWNK